MGYSWCMGDPQPGTWIPKDRLIEGNWYKGKCRNASIAQWKEGRFHYMRHKFGHWFKEEIECPEDDRGFDVFFPFTMIDPPEDGYYKKPYGN